MKTSSASAESAGPDSARFAGLREGFRALRHRNYRLFWSGQVVSVIGTWMSMLALSYLVAYELDASPFELSLVGAFQFGPILLLGLVGGIVADRFPKRAILLTTQSLAAVQAMALAVLVATDAIRLWQVYALALGLGIVNAADMPTRQAFVSELVSRDDVMNAVALNAAVFNAGRVVGPAVAGMLLAAFGPAICFGINAVSFLPVIVGLSLMRFPARVREAQIGTNLDRLKEGLRYVRTTPAVALLIILVGFVGTFGMNFNLWIPLLAKHELETGAAGFGVMMSSLGVGSLIGALWLAFQGKRPRHWLTLGAALALGGLELTLAVAGTVGAPYLAALPILAGMGFAMSTTMASANTSVQTTAPDALRGRVMSVYMTVFAGTVPIGSLVVGSVADAFGTPASLALGGAVTTTAALAVLAAGRRVARPGPVVAPAPAAPLPSVRPIRTSLPTGGALPASGPLSAHRDD